MKARFIQGVIICFFAYFSTVNTLARNIDEEFDAQNTQAEKIDLDQLSKHSGPLIIFVNGFGGNDPAICRVLNARLRADGYQTVYTDWNDIYMSTNKGRLGADLKFTTQMILEVMPRIPKSRPVVMIGHSFGGDSIIDFLNIYLATAGGTHKFPLVATLDPVMFGNFRCRKVVPRAVDFLFNRWTQHPTNWGEAKIHGSDILDDLIDAVDPFGMLPHPSTPFDAGTSGHLVFLGEKDRESQLEASFARWENGSEISETITVVQSVTRVATEITRVPRQVVRKGTRTVLREVEQVVETFQDVTREITEDVEVKDFINPFKFITKVVQKTVTITERVLVRSVKMVQVAVEESYDIVETVFDEVPVSLSRIENIVTEQQAPVKLFHGGQRGIYKDLYIQDELYRAIKERAPLLPVQPQASSTSSVMGTTAATGEPKPKATGDLTPSANPSGETTPSISHEPTLGPNQSPTSVNSNDNSAGTDGNSPYSALSRRRSLNRVEFFEELQSATNLPLSTYRLTFKDPPSSQQEIRSLSALAEAKIVRGYADGYVRPSRPISRYEAFACAYRAIGSPTVTEDAATDTKPSIVQLARDPEYRVACIYFLLKIPGIRNLAGAQSASGAELSALLEQLRSIRETSGAKR